MLLAADVLITEFAANNDNGLRDEDGRTSDWIELFNAGDEAADLAGWSLTDDADDLAKWTLPSTSLAPGVYLVVFASSKDRAIAGGELHTNFSLDADGEYLALVEPDGFTVSFAFTPTYPPQINDVSYGLPFVEGAYQRSERAFFPAATPAAVNGVGLVSVGPVIDQVSHTPKMPAPDEDVFVTARVTHTFDPVATVTLNYRAMNRRGSIAEMFDDGQHGDGQAGDGVYGATIPGGTGAAGEMIRYHITADDDGGIESRAPIIGDPLDSDQFFGTVVADPTIDSNLPVMHLFVDNPSAANTDQGTRVSLFFNGEFYNNVQMDIHGQSTRSFPRKSYDLDFNRNNRFQMTNDTRRMKDVNLLTNWADKSKLRNTIAYETYRDAGAPYHLGFPVRVQMNGQFFSTYDLVEDGDDRYVERLGLDPDGALYKMYNTLNSSTSGAEKKTRRDEGNADLQALIEGAQRNGNASNIYLFDNIDIPGMVNYLAAMIITGGVDCCHKNYYAYRDTNGTGEWRYLPWDVDLTFGRTWTSQNNYFDNNLFVTHGLFVGGNNTLIRSLFDNPRFREMYLRRVRSLMDELLQPPPPIRGPQDEGMKYEARIDELVEQVELDAPLDFARWGSWGDAPTWDEQINILRNIYLPQRRRFLYEQQTVGNGGEIPAEQPESNPLEFGRFEVNPASGDQDHEYVEILNPNSHAVDISGWRLEGSVQMTFKPGTVIPAGEAMFVSPNVNGFRSRGSRIEITGRKGLFVQGDYQGHLPNSGGTLRIVDTEGAEAASIVLPGDPSPVVQHLRITEMMYHPPDPPPASPFDASDFEFLELTNTGDEMLDLTTARFTNGITFEFAGAAVTTLDPGAHLLLVTNQAAFASLYGAGLNIAGEYDGRLDNAGERIRLEDVDGVTILDFTYVDAWRPTTDGGGHSLVIVDPAAATSAWGEATGWRASSFAGGSPGVFDPIGLLGDTNGDGRVDLEDLNNVRNNFGGDGTGDTNDDGIVDLADLNNVRNNFGAMAAPAPLPTLAPTPRVEPTAAAVDEILAAPGADRRERVVERAISLRTDAPPRRQSPERHVPLSESRPARPLVLPTFDASETDGQRRKLLFRSSRGHGLAPSPIWSSALDQLFGR